MDLLSIFGISLLCIGFTAGQNVPVYPQNAPQQNLPIPIPGRTIGGVNAPVSYFNRPLTMGQTARYERYPDLRNQLRPDYRRDPLLYSYGPEWGDKSPESRGGVTEQVNIQFQLPFYGGMYNYTIISTDGYIAFAPPPRGTANFPQFPNPRYPKEADHPFIAPFYTKASYTRRSRCYYRTMSRGQVPNEKEYQRVQFHENDLILEMALRDIHYGIIGAADFVPMHGLLVTWANVTFEGKAFDDDRLESEPVPENTFQALVVTDGEARTYAIFNYKEVSWTTHSGAYGDVHNGLGGHPARVGFNGGNGTGFWELAPFSKDTRLAQIDERSNIDYTGRYVFRIDEIIQAAGCVEGVYQGVAYASPSGGSMLGGDLVNVTGPCFLPSSQIRCKFGQYETVGVYLNPVQAKCITPLMYEAGWREFGVSVDAGRTYNFRGEYFVVQHARVSPYIQLRNIETWLERRPQEPLILEWDPKNITWADGFQVDIGVWGYRETSTLPDFIFLDNIATNVPNSGRYTFDANNLNPKYFSNFYTMGLLRINVTESSATRTDEYPHLWSELVPLSWYFHKQWESTIDGDYGGKFCRDWYYQDRLLPPFLGSLEACPCTLAQAYADKGRYLPDFDCDADGRSQCLLHREAYHCVQGLVDRFLGAGQECCYERDGSIIMTHDKIWGGNPNRAHPWGTPPYREARKVPSLSYWFHDVMPWYYCCQWSGNCEYYGHFRRVSHDCVGYYPPGAAIAFGDPHFITFDNIQYGYHGKGDYVLLKSDLKQFLINVQARLEQPARESFGTINATVIRAVAMKENDSDTVEIQARESHKRWRYQMQILVNGVPRFFDRPWLKLQTFRGVSIQSAESNLDQSNVVVRFASGIGVEVSEVQGYLHVVAYVPREIQNHTYGLFGNWSGIPEDDLKTSTGIETNSLATDRSLFNDFAKTWAVQNNEITGTSLFQYHAYRGNLLLNEQGYEWLPVFEEPITTPTNTSLTMAEVDLLCGAPGPANKECRYDYLITANRYVASATANAKTAFLTMRNEGLQPVISCGGMFAPKHAIREASGILGGNQQTFSCEAGYYLYGDSVWTCDEQLGRWNYGTLPYCMSLTEWAVWICGIALCIVLGVFVPIAFILLLYYTRARRAIREESIRKRGEKASLAAPDLSPPKSPVKNGSATDPIYASIRKKPSPPVVQTVIGTPKIYAPKETEA